MRKLLLIAGIAAATIIPTFAFAQQSCEEQRNNRVAGTVVGAGIGAVLGDLVAPRGDKTAGAVIGGVGGAVIGNQLAKPNAYCAHAYGYYDRGGRWVAGETTGAYDADGHWMPGAENGHRGSDGVWVADAQRGYYDSNRVWRRGPVVGYYDERGVWIGTVQPTDDHRSVVGYQDRHDGANTLGDTDSRENWLEQRIRSSADDGSLSRYDARRAMDDLRSIRRRETSMRHEDGGISQRDGAYLDARLDHLSNSLHLSRNETRAGS
ncbi:MAG: glycine zipper 2TM domain-containing protein [Caulobacterales bacterium]